MFFSCALLWGFFWCRSGKAPLARAADHPETEPLPLRLEDKSEAGRGPCRPHGARPPDGVAAASGVAPDAAVVPFSSRRRGGESCGSRGRGTRSAKVGGTTNNQYAGPKFEPAVSTGFWSTRGQGARVVVLRVDPQVSREGRGSEEWFGCQAASGARCSLPYPPTSEGVGERFQAEGRGGVRARRL